MKTGRLASYLVAIVLLVGASWALLNYQSIIDQYIVKTKPLSNSAQAIADQTQFSDRGRFFFAAAQPDIESASEFNNHCGKKEAESVVLGCYIAPQNLYIYNVSDSRLAGVQQVTAAHEMLHAAYDRLSLADRKKVNDMIERALPEVLQAKTDVASRLQLYEKTEPGERDNELHSILGSEAEGLPAELESYYKQYFKDRSIITSYAASYSKVFNDIKANQDTLVSQLKVLNDEIGNLTANYNSDAVNLKNDIDAFNARAAEENGFSSQAEFNAQRARLSSRLNELEAERQTVNDKISQYEQKRNELMALNVQVEELNSKLDSTALPSL